MKKILGIGNALVDVMTQITDDKLLEEFSLPKGSMQLVDEKRSNLIKSETVNFKRTFSPGGSAANTIHGLAMLGAGTGFIGSIGKDETGDIFEAEMKRAGVKTFLSLRDSITGTAIALITRDKERTFATHLGAAVELDAKDLDPDFFNGFDIFYLEGYLINNLPLVESACKIAREKNMTIALDLSSYNVVEAYLNDFKKIVGNYVDVIFANEDEARVFTGLAPEEAVKKLSEYCSISVVKIGPAGSWLKKGEELIKVDSMPVRCKDTTGAGDLYASGFLYAYANDLDLEKCGILGSMLAGNVIEVVGAKIKEEKWPVIKKYVSILTRDKSNEEN
ncbi:MAG TPA: adenosine kinase [Bacteroidales bacterium]|nr:adenosine kinase [Bacteroidales bacterium]